MLSKGKEPGPFAAQAYDAFTVVAFAIEQGSKDRQDFLNNLGDADFSGVSGEIFFDENGDIEGSYEVYVVQGGSFVREQ